MVLLLQKQLILYVKIKCIPLMTSFKSTDEEI